MKKLRKRVQENIVEPNEEQRALLRSSREQHRCSSLGLKNQEAYTQILLETLAEIILEAFLYERSNSRANK